MGHAWKSLLLITFFFNKGIANDCVPYRIDNEVIACVCNATYCDGLPDGIPEVPEEGNSYWYVTNKQGLRMKMSEVKFDSCENFPVDVTLTIDNTKKVSNDFWLRWRIYRFYWYKHSKTQPSYSTSIDSSILSSKERKQIHTGSYTYWGERFFSKTVYVWRYGQWHHA